MKLMDKIKSKLFPDEKEILYYEKANSNTGQKENRFVDNSPKSEDMPLNYKPQAFSNTEEISDALKKGNVVVVDISLLNKAEALRMIDFLGGVMYALNGDMKRINKTTFEFTINKK